MSNTIATTTCCGDRRNWVDEPAEKRHGWIRTTCGVCGHFLGYREAKGSPPRDSRRKKTSHG